MKSNIIQIIRRFFLVIIVIFVLITPHVVLAQNTQTQTNSNTKTSSEIETQVKAEYDKVYAAEIKKKTPPDKAKEIATKAAEKKRAELTKGVTNKQTVETASGDKAVYLSRTYDGVDWEGTLSIKNPSGLNDVTELITKLINWLLMIIAMVSTIIIIYSGILLVFNGGNESTVTKAKTTIIWAIVGLIVSVSAFALVNIVQTLL